MLSTRQKGGNHCWTCLQGVEHSDALFQDGSEPLSRRQQEACSNIAAGSFARVSENSDFHGRSAFVPHSQRTVRCAFCCEVLTVVGIRLRVPETQSSHK